MAAATSNPWEEDEAFCAADVAAAAAEAPAAARATPLLLSEFPEVLLSLRVLGVAVSEATVERPLERRPFLVAAAYVVMAAACGAFFFREWRTSTAVLSIFSGALTVVSYAFYLIGPALGTVTVARSAAAAHVQRMLRVCGLRDATGAER
jgi:glutathione S-transferase